MKNIFFVVKGSHHEAHFFIIRLDETILGQSQVFSLQQLEVFLRKESSKSKTCCAKLKIPRKRMLISRDLYAQLHSILCTVPLWDRWKPSIPLNLQIGLEEMGRITISYWLAYWFGFSYKLQARSSIAPFPISNWLQSFGTLHCKSQLWCSILPSQHKINATFDVSIEGGTNVNKHFFLVECTKPIPHLSCTDRRWY